LKPRAWLVLAGNVVGAGLLVYCAAPRSGEQPDPAVRATTTPTPSATPPRAAASAAPADDRLAEEHFTPFVARPAFAAVADALEQGDPARALNEIDRAVKAAPPAPPDVPRVALFTGLVAERAERRERALAAYEAADRPSYVLFGHARAGRANMLVQLGRAAEGLALARSIPDEPALVATKRAAIAAAARASGDVDTAMATWRTTVASAPAAERWTAALSLAELLLDPTARAVTRDGALEALRLARNVAAEAAGRREISRRAEEIAGRALAALPPPARSGLLLPSVEDEVLRVEALIEARRFDEALATADGVSRRSAPPALPDANACRLEVARGKALSGQRDHDKAYKTTSAVAERCTADRELHARALFNAGKYAALAGRFIDATRYYARLEAEHPESSLCDDGRLGAALAQLELGVEARFTELITSMPDDFPGGDMVAEGLFRLALRRMDRGDWSGAVSVLERATKVVGDGDAARGGELAGRELYFLGRGELRLGQRQKALERFERIVSELPLSYYMLHAHARLLALDAPRARKARETALERAKSDGRPRVPSTLLEQPGMQRALELIRVSESDGAVKELDALGLTGPGAAPELLWAAARTVARAGAEKLAHDVVRQRLTDWLGRWPAGDWMEAWRVAFPVPFRALVESAAARQKLEVPLVFAVIREESAFDPEAESSADAYGLMQLILPTARVAARGTGLPHDRRALKRPRVNVELGCRTLARYMKAFPENPLLGVPAYNAGPNRARAWLAARPSADFDLWVELIPFVETRRYTKRVLSSRATYAFLYQNEFSEQSLALPERVQ